MPPPALLRSSRTEQEGGGQEVAVRLNQLRAAEDFASVQQQFCK